MKIRLKEDYYSKVEGRTYKKGAILEVIDTHSATTFFIVPTSCGRGFIEQDICEKEQEDE